MTPTLEVSFCLTLSDTTDKGPVILVTPAQGISGLSQTEASAICQTQADR